MRGPIKLASKVAPWLPGTSSNWFLNSKPINFKQERDNFCVLYKMGERSQALYIGLFYSILKNYELYFVILLIDLNYYLLFFIKYLMIICPFVLK